MHLIHEIYWPRNGEEFGYHIANITSYNGNDRVIVANGNFVSITHIGYCSVNGNVKLLDVLVVLHITKNLMSINKSTSDYPVDELFTEKSFLIQSWTIKEPLARGKRSQGLYILEQGNSTLVGALHTLSLKASFEIWNHRLRHVPFSVISSLNKLGQLNATSFFPKHDLCSPYLIAKSKYLLFSLNEKRALRIYI